MSTETTLDPAQIAETAFHLWEQDGRPHGRDHEHWFRAIALLKDGAISGETAAPKAKKRAAPKRKTAEAAPKRQAVAAETAGAETKTARARKTAAPKAAVADKPAAKPRVRKTKSA